MPTKVGDGMLLKYHLRGIALNILHALRTRKIVENGKTGIESLVDLLPIIVAATTIIGITTWIFRRPVMPKLWVRKGNVVKAFPVFQAMRITRKHKGWEFVGTEPIRRISRWQAFKILLLGDGRWAIQE